MAGAGFCTNDNTSCIGGADFRGVHALETLKFILTGSLCHWSCCWQSRKAQVIGDKVAENPGFMKESSKAFCVLLYLPGGQGTCNKILMGVWGAAAGLS